MIRLAILTYNCRHRKTYDTLCLLKAEGFTDVTVYAQSMTYKKRYPLINNRPELIMDIPDISELCRDFGYSYIEGQFTETIHNGKDLLFLLCGAGSLSEKFIKQHRIIIVNDIRNCTLRTSKSRIYAFAKFAKKQFQCCLI